MSKSVNQRAYEMQMPHNVDGWHEMSEDIKIAYMDGIGAAQLLFASHLRSLGEQEKTYALQDCMERAARAIEEME